MQLVQIQRVKEHLLRTNCAIYLTCSASGWPGGCGVWGEGGCRRWWVDDIKMSCHLLSARGPPDDRRMAPVSRATFLRQLPGFLILLLLLLPPALHSMVWTVLCTISCSQHYSAHHVRHSLCVSVASVGHRVLRASESAGACLITRWQQMQSAYWGWDCYMDMRFTSAEEMPFPHL